MAIDYAMEPELGPEEFVDVLRRSTGHLLHTPTA